MNFLGLRKDRPSAGLSEKSLARPRRRRDGAGEWLIKRTAP
jgi:hypothetical protein